MKIPPSSFRHSLSWLLIAAGTAAAAPGCGLDGQESGAETETEVSPIIGGSAVSVATRRQLGLIDVSSFTGFCSGSLTSPDWVITATHCLDFTSVGSNTFGAPRPDGTIETRSAIAVEQAGISDVSIVELAPPGPGSTWPNVTRSLRFDSPSVLIGRTIDCYGRGASAYVLPSGVTGLGGWRTLHRLVTSVANGALVTLATATGTETAAPGDSGGGCFFNGQTVGVGSFVSTDCADPTTTATCAATITKIKSASWRSPSEFQNYIEQAPNRTGTSSFALLTLQNGWTGHPFSANDPASALVQNTIHLRGAIATTGTNPVAFTLPVGSRPSAEVYIPINLCASAKGRLHISVSGVTEVQAEGANWPAAQCFASLDGASFAVDNDGATNLALAGGWVNSPFSTRPAAARVVNGVVRLQGAISSGTTNTPFTLPVGFRPPAPVYVPVDLCGAAKGRLFIQSNGVASLGVFGTFADAQCFTSLEGVAFQLDSAGAILTLQNGWTATVYGTRSPVASNVDGIIRFSGAMATIGTTAQAFTLPAQMRPATFVYIPVDLCNSAKGRLFITPLGTVSVQTIAGQWSSAQCFTSLEGASFGL